MPATLGPTDGDLVCSVLSLLVVLVGVQASNVS